MLMTLKEKMAAGLIYTDLDSPELAAEHRHCLEVLHKFNHSEPGEIKLRAKLLKEILGGCPEDFWIEPPLRCSYGYNTFIGNHFYANYNLTIIDDVKVEIGEHVLIAPNVVITTSGHPVHPDLRLNGGQFSKPIKIGNHVWLGANVVILPGIEIGDNSVIGAGSIVTKNIPPNVVAVGNPCKVLRQITDKDRAQT
ncbi:MAG: sugar O-acetyltransferase [Lentisphaerae bacterium]|nr:sugar O-acetyltransferase [Lentisphaerota bacterium]